MIRRRTRPARAEPVIIGIDDFAFRRNHRYGTLICDLERRRPLNLLPDREPATARAWLRDHPTIQAIARDRGGGLPPGMTIIAGQPFGQSLDSKPGVAAIALSC